MIKVLGCVYLCTHIWMCVWVNTISDVNGNGQRDAGSGMKSKMSGISSATRIRSIQQGRGLIEQPWLGFGRRQAGTRQCMTRPNSLA